MPLDALCLSGLVHELNGALSGARIDKIYQPGRDEVVLALRAPGGNVKLLLSANPNHPRPQLTQLPRENPDAPPMFCMLLRKHLSGGRILSIAQPHLERVVEIRLEALDELGDRVERRLVLEAMGRHSNLILLDGVPVYNVDHLLGFFSVFTPEAVKKVTLFKSSFPARFGGRLSSVIDVRTNDGDMKNYHGVVSVGLLTSKINFEGPIIKNRLFVHRPAGQTLHAQRREIQLLLF